MAEGCNLYLTDRDYRQIQASLSNKNMARVCESVKQEMRNFHLGSPEKIIRTLENRNHPVHKVVAKYLVRNVGGLRSLPDQFQRLLPSAIAQISRIHPEILELIRPIESENSASDKLGQKIKGNAFAFELLGTSKLMEKELRGPNQTKLRIHKSDQLESGINMHKPSSRTGPREVVQPKKRGLKADLFIRRPTWGLGTKTIGVDFRLSFNSDPNTGKVTTSTIDQIKERIQSGTIDEYHFVTNRTVPSEIKARIESANDELKESGRQQLVIGYFERFRV